MGDEFAIFYLIAALFLLVLGVLWFMLPFAVFGINKKMDKVGELLKETNSKLDEVARVLAKANSVSKKDSDYRVIQTD